MQGSLFNVGVLLFGHTLVGRLFGAALASLWGFMQPLLIYYCTFGEMLIKAIQGLDELQRAWLPFELPSIWYLACALISIKVTLALTVSFFAPKVSNQLMAKYTSRMTSASIKRKPNRPVPEGNGRLRKIAFLAAKDMLVWPFIACVVLTGVSFWFVEGGLSTLWVINTLRPIAIGFLIFFCMRVLPMEKVAQWLEGQHMGIGQAFRIALFKVRQM
jgi:hypothetical protein